VSTAGGVSKVPGRAQDIRASVAQIFPSNPRQWEGKRPGQEDLHGLGVSLGQMNISLFIHTIYLANPAGPDPQVRLRSSSAIAHALEVGAATGALGVVTHIGSRKGDGLKNALRRVQESVSAALKEVSKNVAAESLPSLLLEPGAGGGGSVGRTPEECESLLSLLPDDTGLCLDTAHLFAAGYAIHTEQGLNSLLEELTERNLMERVQLIHLNDSKSSLGSRRDRHENIGEGQIGEEGLSRFITHPKLADLPFILEVPGLDGKGPDLENVRRAHRLAGRRIQS